MVFALHIYPLSVSPSGFSKDLHEVKAFILTQLEHTVPHTVANPDSVQESIKWMYNLG